MAAALQARTQDSLGEVVEASTTGFVALESEAYSVRTRSTSQTPASQLTGLHVMWITISSRTTPRQALRYVRQL